MSLDNLISCSHKAIQTEMSQLSATGTPKLDKGLDTAGPENLQGNLCPASLGNLLVAMPSTVHRKVSPNITLPNFLL